MGPSSWGTFGGAVADNFFHPGGRRAGLWGRRAARALHGRPVWRGTVGDHRHSRQLFAVPAHCGAVVGPAQRSLWAPTDTDHWHGGGLPVIPVAGLRRRIVLAPAVAGAEWVHGRPYFRGHGLCRGCE